MKDNLSFDNQFKKFNEHKSSEEKSIFFLKNEIQEGINSGRFENFDLLEHLISLKDKKKTDSE